MSRNILRFWANGSQDPFEPLFRHAPILMHSIDGEGRLTAISRFWLEKMGYDETEVLGRPSTDFLTEESRRHALDHALPRVLRDGHISSVEYDMIKKNGNTLSVTLSAIAQYDDYGNFRQSLAIMFDNADAKTTHEDLKHQHRMEAIGQLVAGVAHDFNNLITVIQGNLEFLRDDPDNAGRMSFINDALQGARRGASLTQHLLAYGRKTALTPQEADLNQVVIELESMVRRVMPAKIGMELVCGAGLWPAAVDRHQLDTALINILTNARDAMPDGGKITIETCNVRISPEYAELYGEDIVPGRYVMLAITDTGLGIDPKILRQIFEPYFTTKPAGAGSGLGLSMVFGFVKQSGGLIRTYSELGYGTTFRLYFPAERNAKIDAQPPSEGLSTGDPGARPAPMAAVLVAEDDVFVRRVLVTQLRLAGISVSEATSGDMALELLTTGYRPKVLVTDIVMPGAVQGPELAEQARRLIDGLQVAFISGYPREAAIHGFGIGDDEVQIIKPVERAAFVEIVQKLLEA